MEEKTLRRFGPVTFCATVLGAAFGTSAVILQRRYFLGLEARTVIVGGVVGGVSLGILLGALWEVNLLPRRRIRMVAELLLLCGQFVVVVLAILAVPLVTLKAFQFQRDREHAKLLFQSGGKTLGDEQFLQYVGDQIIDDNLEHVKELDETTFLEIHGTNVRGPGLENIARWNSLRRLFLIGSPIGDEGLMHLKGLENLERLELSQTGISDNGLVHLRGLKNLRKLSLTLTSVSDKGLLHLHSLKSLAELNLDGTNVTRAGVAALQEAIPSCIIVFDGRDGPVVYARSQDSQD